MDQTERTAEQVDPRSDDRRPDPVVVEHERFDQVVGMAPMVRRVDDAAAARRGFDWLEVLADAFDLAQDRIERVLQRAIDGVSLRRLELVEVGFDPLTCGATAFAVAALQVPRDLFSVRARHG